MDVTTRPAHARPTNTVFRDYALFPHLSVGANVGFGLSVEGVPRQQRRRRVAQTLELVGLAGAESWRIAELSDGPRLGSARISDNALAGEISRENMATMPDTGTVVAVAQLALAVGELDANRQAARAAVAEAAAAGARLVVLPELSDSGYVFSDADEARSCASPAATGVTPREWRSLAGRHNLVIAGGFCELGPDGRLYNSAAIVDASGTRAVYRKAHLWDAEKKIFTPGDDAPPVVELPFGNVGLMICYDLEFPEWVRLAALNGADLIAVPVNWASSGSPAPPGQRSGEVIAAQAAASSNGVFIAVADRCNTERGVDWLGGSVIIRRGGYPAAGPLCANRAAVLTATIDLRLARDKRIGELNDLFTDRRPDLYARLRDVAYPAATTAG